MFFLLSNKGSSSKPRANQANLIRHVRWKGFDMNKTLELLPFEMNGEVRHSIFKIVALENCSSSHVHAKDIILERLGLSMTPELIMEFLENNAHPCEGCVEYMILMLRDPETCYSIFLEHGHEEAALRTLHIHQCDVKPSSFERIFQS
jgi:hypothetical protein